VGARIVFLRCGWCIKSFAWPMCLPRTTATTTQLFNIIKYFALSRMRIAFAFAFCIPPLAVVDVIFIISWNPMRTAFKIKNFAH